VLCWNSRILCKSSVFPSLPWTCGLSMNSSFWWHHQIIKLNNNTENIMRNSTNRDTEHYKATEITALPCAAWNEKTGHSDILSCPVVILHDSVVQLKLFDSAGHQICILNY
jgi:hypothetical protein